MIKGPPILDSPPAGGAPPPTTRPFMKPKEQIHLPAAKVQKGKNANRNTHPNNGKAKSQIIRGKEGHTVPSSRGNTWILGSTRTPPEDKKNKAEPLKFRDIAA